ncbi:FecCD family ABC transporter permease [Nesterenkonia aerolata]|uniref:Iron chelate uptake ABC transporter family permease subunit n=1 Tax=Nesterenkonia aerolata TaxID=3074079 RepID=A0ABU2DPY9_9MICC|nr:iron chelate uptake ABC transporter family permease subunit [Nesterenkonia sp. LY-0111]MDR8018574.1 iron chelate uptake ABC transporter family permease subunit [Nesterenkonia sp. LY-0111]
MLALTRTLTRPAVAAVVGSVLLVGLCVLSLFIGSGGLSPQVVWQSLVAGDGGIDHQTVTALRVPRTLLGVLVGAALGVAGALAQAVTRNPLADPGLLGVTAGAGLAVALSVAVFGLTTISGYLWFALAGAFLGAALVYALAMGGTLGATPVRLVLVGVAVSGVFTGASRALAMLRPQVFDRMRFWDAGSLADRPAGTLEAVAPLIGAGVILALVLARSLNAMGLGDEAARSVGVNVTRTRWLSVGAITVLCAAATAAAGPIAFVGLMVPHALRPFVGTDQRRMVMLCLLFAPSLLVGADVLGRLVVRPAELQVGVVVALLGAPVLIALIRHSHRNTL